MTATVFCRVGYKTPLKAAPAHKDHSIPLKREEEKKALQELKAKYAELSEAAKPFTWSSQTTGHLRVLLLDATCTS